METKFKIGDKVKTYRGDGKIVGYNNGQQSPYQVEIGFFTGYFNNDNLTLIEPDIKDTHPELLVNYGTLGQTIEEAANEYSEKSDDFSSEFEFTKSELITFAKTNQAVKEYWYNKFKSNE